MRSLKLVKEDHPMCRAPVQDNVEHVYSAVEYDTLTGDNAVSIVCYRTADSMTHQVEIRDGVEVPRKSVKKF